jgi:ABC-type multidrug transport system ATPase subunit
MDNLIVNKVVKSFGHKNILIDINFECRVGEIIGLLGKNGCGKSTLLKILFGTITADMLDVELNSTTFDPFSNIRTRTIAYLAQDSFLPKDIKVRNIIPIYYPNGEQQDRIFYDPRIAGIERQKVGSLSHGQSRYLEILLISGLPHRFILLDEPFSMVEPLYQDAIKELLLKIKPHKGIILTDHYYYDVLQIADRNILIKDGQTFAIRDKSNLADYGYISAEMI